jgi:hypothetical protein
MATKKQTQAAKRNVKKAQRAATQKRTIAKLPESTRRSLGQQAARGRQRKGRAGHGLDPSSAPDSRRTRGVRGCLCAVAATPEVVVLWQLLGRAFVDTVRWAE